MTIKSKIQQFNCFDKTAPNHKMYIYRIMNSIVANFKLKKFAFRVIVITSVYLLIKLTIDHKSIGAEGHGPLNITSLIYYVSAFFLFMFVWETNDWLIRRRQERKGTMYFKDSLRILGINIATAIPVIAITYYIIDFQLYELCDILPEDRPLRFRIDFFRALLLTFAVATSNLFYFSLTQKKKIEEKMEKLQRELISSQYATLKSQISPHFLFNSLNILTSLMYEDRDLASDFVTRLASCYRYILDNREEDIVPLKKELTFLESFIFMMNVRHEGALHITNLVTMNTEELFIPTLSLQMLVENALKHNYYSQEKPLEISISSIGKDSIIVQNTLRKRIPEEVSTQLGLKNIQKRYAFYTNKEVLIEDHGGFFKVTMPLLSKDQTSKTFLSVS